MHMAPTPKDHYPPEIIVLLSPNAPNPASNVFCDRIIRVEHIPMTKCPNEKNDSETPCLVQASDENCCWTKLRLFGLEGYDTILYIDADCLVLKDVSHLLHIDNTTISPEETGKTVGLLAAAPEIFAPDKFNAGVMLLRPSESALNEMMCNLGVITTFEHDTCNPNQELANSASKPTDSTKIYTSCEGGETGFLNHFYSGWHNDIPSYSRLPFGYNAQPLMYKHPKYCDETIGDISIIHFSSTPKPWETTDDTSKTKEDQTTIKMSNCGMLESMWRAAYEKSLYYHTCELQKKKASRSKQRLHAKPTASPLRSSTPPAKTKPKNVHSQVHKRYNELRRAGMGVKEAMSIARADFGLDMMDDRNPARAVGQMFGLN
jgi:hypothetical protein